MKLFLFLLLFTTSLFAQPAANSAHLKQTFRYAKDVNPVDFLKLDPRIIEMIGGISAFCKEHNVTFMITSGIRTPQRNKEVFSVSNTHVEGRAIDFSVNYAYGWNERLIIKLERYVEQRYGEYGVLIPNKKQKVLLVHRALKGNLHGHLQVTKQNNDTYTKVLDTMEDIVRIR